MLTKEEKEKLEQYYAIGRETTPSGEWFMMPGRIALQTKSNMEDVYEFLLNIEDKYNGRYLKSVLYIECSECHRTYLSGGLFDHKNCPSCGRTPTLSELADSYVVFQIVDSE